DAPLVEKLVSNDKLEKKIVSPTKIEFVRLKQQEKLVRKPVKYAEMYRLTAITIKGKGWPNSAVANAIRTNQGHLQKVQEDQGYVDSGCSRHMTGNMSYLSDFKEFNRGYVTFGGGANGGKTTGKGTLKTGKLDFEDVYFVKELNFNLFSVSHMCDRKNNVLFTDTECLVLSHNFKLPDESQILIRVPRKNNMYNVDMKNIVPKECLTCLVAKATLDESMLWHRRLGHVNFKTINKLVKENLVRGLPTKRFENDQTCVACLKEKQHKASCKSKIQNSITQSLLLNMDLFGLNFMSSLMYNKYCLVVTDDYSRFTWVFFLASKDETSDILKRIITEIENLVDKKVKIIRCDNGTKFKNRVMSEFCEKEGVDYDEVFAPVARIEAIRLFLAYASFMGFMVYHMDVNSAFLYGRIEEEVYVCQPLGFEDPDHPDKVYVDDIIFGSTKKELCIKFERLMKDKFQMSSMGELTFFLGLQVKQKEDGIFISQDKYVAEVLRKFNFPDVKSASTPVDIEKTLVKDADGISVLCQILKFLINSH
ncbi:putative ribonuclease H-like domain-containing protein, partial [Tanacetum coccineum]